MLRNKGRILFVVPPVRLSQHEYDYLVHWPRHALVMAAELGDEYDVAILDVTAEFHRSSREQMLRDLLHQLIIEKLDSFRPDVVALHAHAAPHVPVVAEALKALSNSTHRYRLVVGGMAASHLTSTIANLVPAGTWIVKGEATGRSRDIFDFLLGRSEAIEEPDSVEPIGKNVTVITIRRNPPLLEYPRPRFELLPMDVYADLYSQGAFSPHLELTSGCTYRCTFCGVHYPDASGRFRTRPVHNVVNELEHLQNTYGFTEFYFCDETFSLDRDLSISLCREIIKHLPEIRWRCVTRTDCVDEEVAALMAEAGCREVAFGIETGADVILRRIAKRSSTDLNSEAIALVQRHGIDANALLIIGLPDEDHKDIRRTFEYIVQTAKPKICQVFIFHPVPGTIYFSQPQRFGLNFSIAHIHDWYMWDHIGEPVCDTKFLSKSEIVRYYLLFNRALATVVDPTPDPDLIQRIIENRFPIRRKGVTWIREPGRLIIYRLRDPSGSVLQNSVLLEDDEHGAEGNLIDIAQLVLSLADGSRTKEELVQVIAANCSMKPETVYRRACDIISLLEEDDLLTEF